jgi:sulfate transport system permease protein
MSAAIDTNRRVLPGFALSLGFTIFYLSLMILVPMAAGFWKVSRLSFADFWAAVSSDRAIAAYTLTVGASFASAGINILLGFVVAWVLVRYEFPCKRLLDSLVDFPFALPTAVAGLVFSALFVKNGWYGRVLVPLGIDVAYTRLGIVLVLVFIGFPFVVRTLQPVLEGLERDVEEASACLGANRLQTFRSVILPSITPAMITGFTLAFARSLGEYGSVVFISGNMPFRTEIAPVLVVARLEEFAYGEATAIAIVLLLISFATLLLINLLERWSSRHHG